MKSEKQLFVRPGQPDDVPALEALNPAWQRQQVSTVQHGFIEAMLGPDILSALISKQQLVVATDGPTLASYYLLNTVMATGSHAVQQSKAEELQRAGRLPDVTFGVGAQACLAKLYQGRGLRSRLLAVMLTALANRYDWLFATIPHDNPKTFRAHTSDGWEVVDEDARWFYVWLPVPTSPTKP